MGRVNLVKNPRYHVNLTDAWGAAPAGFTLTRVTSVPGTTLPAGTGAAVKVEVAAGITSVREWLSDEIPIAEGNYVASVWGMIAGGAVGPISAFVVWPSGSESGGGGASYFVGGEFSRRVLDATDESSHVAAGMCRVKVVYDGTGPFSGDAATAYFTAWQIEELPRDVDYADNAVLLPPYADGSTAGWVWDGTAHNSASHQISPVPRARRPFGAGFALTVTSRAGRVVDLTPFTEGFRCTEDEWGGFDSASWTQRVDHRRYYEELLPLGDVVARFDGETIFEGRLTDVGKEAQAGDATVRRMKARGYFDVLQDDESFVRCYSDKNIAAWENIAISGQTGFSIVEGQDDFAEISVNEGQSYVQNARSRLVYRLLEGAAPSSDKIKAANLTIVDSIYGSGWEVELYSRATPGGSNIATVWTSTAQGTHVLSFDNADLDPADTGNVRCLVLRVIYTDASPFSFIGMPATPYGARITASTIVSGTATTLAPEDIVADLVADHTTAGQRSFPDASGLLVGQMVFGEPGTKLDAIRRVNEILRWQFGFIPGGVFQYRKPWNSTTVPDRNYFDLLWADFSPSITRQFSQCYNRCVVRYSDRRGNPKTYTATSTSVALGATTRTASIVAPSGIYDAAGAQNVAEAFLADNSEPVVKGSVPTQGMVRCADGRLRNALHVRPGDLVRFRDTPPEEPILQRVTRVERDVDSLTATLEFGRDPSSLERMMARLDMKTKRRRR